MNTGKRTMIKGEIMIKGYVIIENNIGGNYIFRIILYTKPNA